MVDIGDLKSPDRFRSCGFESHPRHQNMYEPVITEAPEGFLPREQWPEYSLAEDAPAFLGPRIVGRDPKGMYRRFWPIVVEEYISDKEPVLADSDPNGISLNRMLIWQRIFNTDTPKGWRAFSKKMTRLDGFAELTESDYWKGWSESARRYRKKWLAEHVEKTYVIEKASYAEFRDAYKRSTIKKDIQNVFLEIIKRKLASPYAEHVELWCVRTIETKKIVAGMATVTSQSCRSSHYISGFITKEGGPDPVMVGLMDNWYKVSRARDIRFLHFGGFWVPGCPKEWKGFSVFKAKFGLKYVMYPPALFRFVRGRLF
jgi:hypothetical protein